MADLSALDPRTAGVQTEAKLQEWNLAYEYVPEFPIADLRSVDWTQVRGGSNVADKETISQFRTQLIQGAVFPPIVIMDPNVVTDGNHRLATYKSVQRKTIPAFVVRFSSADLAQSFNAAINQMNGRRLSPEEAQHAAETMMARGMADEAIAREIGRTPSHVRQMRQKVEFNKRIEALPELAKIMQERPLNERAQVKLNQIKQTAPFVEATRLAHETGASASMVSEVVQRAVKASSEADAITSIRAYRTELAPTGPAPTRVTVPQAVRNARMWLGGLLNFEQNPPALLDAIDEDHRTKAADQWKRVRDLADAMVRLYAQ